MLNDSEEFCGVVGGGEVAAATKRRRNNYKNRRRFSEEQIRSLELMFESETRLEPRKKLQVARELGLHPRQVAIWFQNKRARWKSKHLEQQYNLLTANYNSLASKFDALKKENQALLLQLQKLNELVNKAGGEQGRDQLGTASASTDGESEDGKPPPPGRREQPARDDEDDDDSTAAMKAELFGLEEPDLISMVDASSEDWCSLDSDALFDESSGSYQWWDFWS